MRKNSRSYRHLSRQHFSILLGIASIRPCRCGQAVTNGPNTLEKQQRSVVECHRWIATTTPSVATGTESLGDVEVALSWAADISAFFPLLLSLFLSSYRSWLTVPDVSSCAVFPTALTPTLQSFLLTLTAIGIILARAFDVVVFSVESLFVFWMSVTSWPFLVYGK